MQRLPPQQTCWLGLLQCLVLSTVSPCFTDNLQWPDIARQDVTSAPNEMKLGTLGSFSDATTIPKRHFSLQVTNSSYAVTIQSAIYTMVRNKCNSIHLTFCRGDFNNFNFCTAMNECEKRLPFSQTQTAVFWALCADTELDIWTDLDVANVYECAKHVCMSRHSSPNSRHGCTVSADINSMTLIQ